MSENFLKFPLPTRLFIKNKTVIIFYSKITMQYNVLTHVCEYNSSND